MDAIEYRVLTADEADEALGQLLCQISDGPLAVRQRIRAFHDYASAMALDIGRQWGAFRSGRLITSCLCIRAPGRTAMLFLPDCHDAPRRKVVCTLLREVASDAMVHGCRLLQVLVEPQATDQEQVLSAAGFTCLAELIYMQRDTRSSVQSGENLPALSWQPYTLDRHNLFAQTIEATYEASLDCPGLAGRRQINDVMESHRATGEFAPDRWLLAVDHETTTGVLLTARVPERDVLEIVYMGLRHEHRGRGIGKAMLRKALRLARQAECGSISLAVDAQNTPALRLYGRDGFRETTRRRAWIVSTTASQTASE